MKPAAVAFSIRRGALLRLSRRAAYIMLALATSTQTVHPGISRRNFTRHWGPVTAASRARLSRKLVCDGCVAIGT